MNRVLDLITAFWLVIATAGLICGCGGSTTGDQSVSTQPGVDPSVLAQVQSLKIPGVDTELTGLLKAELLRSISEYSRDRVVSTPPSGADNSVTDLNSEDDGAGGRNLTWEYRNVGDYDQNSEVNAADITPVGLHYGATSASPSWPAARLADGDGNGEVNVADITPIGRNFNTSCTKYMVYSSTNAGDYPASHDAANGPGAVRLGEITIAESTEGAGGIKLFSYELGAVEAGALCWVRPSDGTQEGSRSNLHEIPISPNEIPLAVITADSTVGDIPMLVEFDASGSSDPDGSIVKYEWDWDGIQNGWVWEDTGATPTTSHTYAEIDTYTAVVRVTDDDGDANTASIQIHATAPGNDPPVVVLTADPTSGPAPLTVSFDASGSYDLDGEIVKYEWSWDWNGDGEFNADADTGATPTASHEYEAGDYTAWVQVTDEIGGEAKASVSISAAQAIWPMFRYDALHNGLSPYVGAQTNNLKWIFTSGASAPAIGWDSTVYVGSVDNNLYAINPDGSLKWAYDIGGVGTPAIGANGTVYVGSDNNNLYAINPDGTLKWSYDSSDSIVRPPAIGADGTVYFGNAGHNLYAINPDGSQKWSFTTGDDSPWAESSPAIGADGTVYVGSHDNKLYAINPDGTLKWTYDSGDWVGSPAIGADGTVYFGRTGFPIPGYYGGVYAINPDGSLKWTYLTYGGQASHPAIGADGTVYAGGSSDGDLYAINPDGSLKWFFHTGFRVEAAPAIGADGTVYVGSFDDNLYAINPDGSLKWAFDTGAWVGSPAIGADGTVYVDSGGKLYAFGE